MKKATIARFVIGLAAISAVGCSAETGAPEAEGVGSSEQAIGIAGLTAGSALQRPGVASLESVVSDSTLLAGGILSNTRTYTNAIQKHFYDGSTAGAFSTFTTTLSGQRYDSQVIRVPGTNYWAIIGGTDSSEASVNTIQVFDPVGDSMIVSKTMANKRGHIFAVAPCGTGSRLLIAGGFDSTGPSRVAPVEVFDFNAGTPASSTVHTLKDTSNNDVSLTTGKDGIRAIPLSTSQILVAGGFDGTNYSTSSELFNVNASCVSTDLNHPATTGALPAARSEYVAAPINITVLGSNYTGLITTGRNGATLPTATYLFKPSNSTWANVAALDVTTGRVDAALAFNGSTAFEIIGGRTLASTFGASVGDVDKFTNSGAGTMAAQTALTTKRSQGFVAYSPTAAVWIAGLGVNSPTGAALNYLTSVE